MRPILPGATVGVLGSGQLGRMFAIAARRMGYRVHTLSEDSDTPTGQISDEEITASYDDLDALRRFASGVAVVTFEFENIPVSSIDAIAGMVPVRPAGSVLNIAQNRIREKTFLQSAGLPVAEFRVVRSLGDLEQGLREIGCPAVLKTASFGYDGKGQVTVQSPQAAEQAWNTIGRNPAVLEAFVDFDCEVSVVAARAEDGSFAHYGLLENLHRNHILDVTIAPARVSSRVAAEAVEMARTLMEKLGVVGVLCVEFFLGRQGQLLINELAPRPHNSGHFSVDACVTSQFEQQLRAVCGLPLGSTEQLRPAAMANLLGDLWTGGEPDWVSVCSHPNVKLHLYGKVEARPGRKMGHLTALAADVETAVEMVLESRRALAGTVRSQRG
jgi:5-(carboxyamino)imidazole ribonucleotide synthase